MHYHTGYFHLRRLPAIFLFLCVLLVILAACGGGGSTNSTSTNTLAAKQVLRFPNVGIQDSASLDPAQGPDANTAQIVSMIYNGLVKSDVNLNVVPDQASSWDISSD
ncbi:MAG TPA: peptide ABC transporter substrate-binding protein, partial [Ktedonobacteraceae bacterium]|nr:peptide ABC transporter substrate-binding protein [Ktedonobacteraceae bacterium]